jgi:hypothetical protein
MYAEKYGSKTNPSDINDPEILLFDKKLKNSSRI